jgi:GNAT superfamily N-acetyltransferase
MSSLPGTYANGLAVETSSVSALEASPEFPALAREYAEETLIDGMPAPSVQWKTYRRLESAGLLAVFTARLDGTLLGFITVLLAELPRYGERVAMSESFFVAKAHRRTGAGLRLLRRAERHARERGSRGLFVSAPCRGELSAVLPRLGYDEAHRIFFKRTSDG